MGAVTLLAHMDRIEAALISAAQNVDADRVGFVYQILQSFLRATER